MPDLNLGAAYIRALFGANARQAPAWLYVQDAGPGAVSFVGGSRVPNGIHPWRYGSDRTHLFAVGELILRPHAAVTTDALRGTGLPGLATADHDIDAMLRGRAGEFVVPPMSDALQDWLRSA